MVHHSQADQETQKLRQLADSLPGDGDSRVRRERKDAAENRQAILFTARELFDRFGVEAVSMHQIAKQAGIGQGTLYRRYAHKADLCMDLMAESCSLIRDRIREHAERSESAPFTERLTLIMNALIDWMAEKSSFICRSNFSSSEEGKPSPYRNPMYEFMHEMLRSVLDKAVERKEIAPLDTVYTADAMLAAVGPDLLQFLTRERGYTVEQIAKCWLRMFALVCQDVEKE